MSEIVRPGEQYYLTAGDKKLLGRRVTIVSVDYSGSACLVQFSDGEKTRCRVSSLSLEPPVLLPKPARVPKAASPGGAVRTPRPPREVPVTRPAKGDRVAQQKMLLEAAPKQRVPPLGKWPAPIPSFSPSQVVLVDVDLTGETVAFREMVKVEVQVETVTYFVGLVWRSSADGMWRCLGGSGKGHTSMEDALDQLVELRLKMVEKVVDKSD